MRIWAMSDTAWQAQDICGCGEILVSSKRWIDSMTELFHTKHQSWFDDAIHWLECQSINLIMYIVGCFLWTMPLQIGAHSIIYLFEWLVGCVRLQSVYHYLKRNVIHLHSRIRMTLDHNGLTFFISLIEISGKSD